VAQGGAVAAGKDRREPAALGLEDRVADRVDAAVEAVEPPAPCSPGDCVAIEAERPELTGTDDTVLAARQFGESHIAWGC
jgi:hypothetical protein